MSSRWMCPGLLRTSVVSVPCFIVRVQGVGRGYVVSSLTTLTWSAGVAQAFATGARSAWYRARRRACADPKIRVRLGGIPEHGATVPERPKGMHATTYERLCAELADLEDEEWERINQAVRAGEVPLLDALATYLEAALGRPQRSAD